MKLTYTQTFGYLTHEESKGQKALRYLYEIIALLFLLAVAPVIVFVLAVVGQEVLKLF